MRLAKVGLLIALFVIIAVCVKYVFFGSPKYYKINPLAVHKNGQKFVGSLECKKCHLDIYESHIKTAHFKSSAKSNSENILGDFEYPHNLLEFSGNKIHMKMESIDSAQFQNVYNTSNDSLLQSRRFDITIGSGVRGQTYLNWNKDSLFQLQASYSTSVNQWINSPGFSRDTIRTARPIIPRCLECHTTFASVDYSDLKNYTYNKEKIVYGIDCERCHGPGGSHVQFHKTFPDSLESGYILKYSDLTGKQKLDVCALCHSGPRARAILPPFTYLTGNNLDNFSFPEYDVSASDKIDVHGNQYGLLKRSKCFVKSKTMDCSTCHNTHENQRGDTTTFVNKCIECHQKSDVIMDCGLSIKERKTDTSNNCVSCHMPVFPSKSMNLSINNGELTRAVELRTHHIAVYPESQKKIEKLDTYINNL